MQVFFDAAREGNISDVNKHLDDGVHADSQDENGNTAWMLAFRGGHEAVCELLITRGCNVDKQSRKDGDTALIRAAAFGHEAVCELLITRGCNVNMQDKTGGTALIWAAENDEIPVVISLIKAGCDYSLRNNQSKSGMDWLRERHPDKVKEVQVSHLHCIRYSLAHLEQK